MEHPSRMQQSHIGVHPLATLTRAGIAIVLVFATVLPLPGQELPAERLPAERLPAERADELRQSIAAWELPSFAARRAASQQLESAGAHAFDLLAGAAIERGGETAQRALDILERGAMGRDPATKTAAQQALERIANSPNGSASRAARERLAELAQSARLASARPAGRAGGAAILVGNGAGNPGGNQAPQLQLGAVRRLRSQLIQSAAQLRAQIAQTQDPRQQRALQAALQRTEQMMQQLQAIVDRQR